MNGKSKNNLNFSKEMSLNIKTSSKNHDPFFKTNNASLDFASSPIKNNKKVIKRNTRTNSYNSFLYNQTENILTTKNPFNSGIISVDSSTKINLKKNIFTFSNTKRTLCNNSKSKNNNNNTKKNKKSKQNIKSRTKVKNITAHQSTSNLANFNININTDNNLKINNDNSNEYVSVNTNPNIASRFILNKKKNTKVNNHSHFQHSNLLNSNDFNYIKDNNFYSFYLQAKPEQEKLYFRNNNTTKNLLFLTRQNMGIKKIQEKNKTSIYKTGKQSQGDPILYSNKKCLDFNFRDVNSNPKLKKNFKNSNTKTTKNSEDKKRNKLNMNRLSNNINNNLLEMSSEVPNNEILDEYQLLNNCLKKRSDTCTRVRSKSGRKENNKNRKKYELFEDNIFTQDSLLGIIYENKQIKQKNEELSKQFESIKKEFEQMKKDNKIIKEELKEKSKYIKDIKLTMDIFSQQLSKLQNLHKETDFNNNSNKVVSSNNRISNSNLNLNLNNLENDKISKSNNVREKQKFVIEVNTKNKNNNDNNSKISNLYNSTNNNFNNNTNYSTDQDNKDKNYIYETEVNNIDNNTNAKSENYLPKKNKLEKIHQLSLNNINNIINQNNKKRGGSLEANFQDTSKIINNETKDATEKDNECLNDKWPSPLYNENKEENKGISKETSKREESIDLTNISLAENLNINEEVYNNVLNSKKNNIGKLDFKNKLNKKNNEENKKNPKKLNFINQDIVNDNFNEEFLKYYDKFSDSWRKEVDKMLKKGKNNK